MSKNDVVIVGAGHAGAQAAIMLRQFGFMGSVTLVSNEPEYPYERPPLSKDYLAGEKAFEKLLIRPAEFWNEHAIEILFNEHVIKIDTSAKALHFASGHNVDYGTLIWAAGGDPRRLDCEGHDLAGVHAVRRRADVLAMMDELDRVERVAVIGGGYIGLEAAAVLTKLGKKVVLLEALPRVLARVAGDELSTFFETEHRSHGVDIRTGISVEKIRGREGRAIGVQLATGEVVDADMVIVGVGIVPSVQPLLEAGAKGGNGVFVDELCRTSLPDIYAVGDCATHVNAFADGAAIRLESVQNANDQATTAARSISGDPQPHRATPWFWSNQYDLRLQTVGLSAGHDHALLRGNLESRSFSIVYLKQGRVLALDCVNQVRDYSHGRRLVETRAMPDPLKLIDTAIALKELL